MKDSLYILLVFLFYFGCSETDRKNKQTETIESVELASANVIKTKIDTVALPVPAQFERTLIKERITTKITNNEPLIIHTMIPLCDNDNQGIVKVSASLGNGLNLKSNLYWGARYGFKTHFKRDASWTLIASFEQPSEHILERVVFERKYPNGTQVLLIGDAYRGDRMRACLLDYFHSLSGRMKNTIILDDERKIAINAEADLLVFNGHNGLMDSYIEPFSNEDGIEKDAVAVACISSSYFNDYFIRLKAYPLLMTTNLLAPEAYVLSNVFDSWVSQADEKEILMSAARGYNEYQKCGIRGAKALFKTGW